MSKPDIHLLALCYELEIERNGGDWRIRNNPTQKGLNGKPPTQPQPFAEKKESEGQSVESKLEELTLEGQSAESAPAGDVKAVDTPVPAEPEVPAAQPVSDPTAEKNTAEDSATPHEDTKASAGEDVSEQVQPEATQEADDAEQEASDDDDSDGWITPSNLKKKQAEDSQVSTPSETIETTLQAALLTSDFAMQNVALRINLLYVYPSVPRYLSQPKLTDMRHQPRLPLEPQPHQEAQDMGPALLRVLQRDAADEQAVLPQVRAGDADADELQHRQLGQDAAAPQAQLPVQQAGERLQHPQAGARHRQRQDAGRAGRRQGPLGQGPHPRRGPARVPAQGRRGPQAAPEGPHGRGLPAEPGHWGEDGWAWADQGWSGEERQCKEEALNGLRTAWIDTPITPCLGVVPGRIKDGASLLI